MRRRRGFPMSDADKTKCSVWVPNATLAKLDDLGFKNRTEFILAGLDCLLKEDHSEIAKRLEEVKAHNETLRNELNQAHRDKQDLKDMHQSHVLQVQSLVTQRVIEEAPKRRWWKIW